jgi:hypothetical protein
MISTIVNDPDFHHIELIVSGRIETELQQIPARPQDAVNLAHAFFDVTGLRVNIQIAHRITVGLIRGERRIKDDSIELTRWERAEKVNSVQVMNGTRFGVDVVSVFSSYTAITCEWVSDTHTFA